MKKKTTKIPTLPAPMKDPIIIEREPVEELCEFAKGTILNANGLLQACAAFHSAVIEHTKKPDQVRLGMAISDFLNGYALYAVLGVEAVRLEDAYKAVIKDIDKSTTKKN